MKQKEKTELEQATEYYVFKVEELTKQCICRNKRERINLRARFNALRTRLSQRLTFKTGDLELKFSKYIGSCNFAVKEMYWAFKTTGSTDDQLNHLRYWLQKIKDSVVTTVSSHPVDFDLVEDYPY